MSKNMLLSPLKLSIRVFCGVAVCALLVGFCQFTSAQSGRHASRTTSPAVPTPEPKQPDVVKKPEQKQKPALTFIVAMDRNDTFAAIPYFYYDAVLKGCADRLDSSPSVRVDVAQHEMGRGEAAKRAKAEQEAWVVWMKLAPDSVGVQNRSAGNQSDIFVEFTLFTPGTAKVKASGDVYPGQSRGLIPTLPGNSSAALEYRLKEAGKEVAQRILSTLNGTVPSSVPVPH